MAQAIYFFDPSEGNITKFETIQATVNEQVGYSFTNQYVKIGDTNILTNITSLIPPFERLTAIIQKTYCCTIFEFNEDTHLFIMSFDGVRYFSTLKAAENFINGIA